ncbi:hypothetical protein IPJ70_01765 [Candidatus Campbellbacteria bacterium]|nr:MAG: hypothetical protein IPJ70_01765 [Candidatus Campbellbacteria bacterium]
MKNTIIALVVIILIGIGGYFLLRQAPKVVDMPVSVATTTTSTTTVVSEDQGDKAEVVIGKSVEGRDIVAYNFGTGTTKLLFVGGIHGGYEWNTVQVAYELMDYLKATPSAIPANVRVTVIPVVNPDGLNKVVGTAGRFTSADVSPSQQVAVSGRFNANNVDLNRNFDCGWQATGTWQNKSVSGGTSAFSEPESKAVRDYVTTLDPNAVVVWYSAAGGVYASSCNGPVSTETRAMTNAYATASGYPAYESFDFYETTGDMVNWLAKDNVPAISVLLTNHTDTEWTKNKAGIEALFKQFAQ